MKRLIIISLLISSFANAQDRFFTYYNAWCMGTDAQWNLGSAYYISTKTYAQHLGKTTHVIIFPERDIIRGDFPPYFSLSNTYVQHCIDTMTITTDTAIVRRDSLNFWYNGYNNPAAGYSAWESRGTIFHLRDSLHAKNRKIILSLNAVTATVGLNFVFADSARTDTLLTSIANWVTRHNFDGIDLNTESGITATNAEFQRFFRIARSKMPDKIICAVPVVTHTARYSGSINEIDFVLPQMYAYALNWQPNPVCAPSGQNGVFLNSPLHLTNIPATTQHRSIADISTVPADSGLTWGPDRWYQAGFPKSKIVMLLSTEANPFEGVDSMFACYTGSKPFWPDTAAYAMITRGGTYHWDSIHVGAYISGTATSSLTSRGVTVDSSNKFYIPVLAKQAIDSIVTWGKLNGYNNYGLFDVSTDARTPDAIKTPLHNHLSGLLNIGTDSILSEVSGNSQTAYVLSTLNNFIVSVKDEYGFGVSGVTVNFAFQSVPSGSTGYSLSTTSVVTDANGNASTALTLGTKKGTYTVNASADILGETPVEFTATANPLPLYKSNFKK